MSEILLIDLLEAVKAKTRFIAQLAMDGVSRKTEIPHKDNRRKY
jgi:hypothetical protein